MSSLSTVEERLPPGFRFHPKDEELICDYLMKQVMGCALHTPLLIEVDLNKCEPWDIPENARVGDKEWYFYSIRDRKYASGIRTNRATKSGYWKATGKDRPVFRKKTLVGMRKTLVFYEGRAPKGTKTDWVMHEFRLQHGPKTPHQSVKVQVQGDWVLCRVLYKTSKSELIPKQQLETSNVSPSSSEYLNIIKLLDDDDEQVPCFSNLATNPSFSSLVTNAVVDCGYAGPYRNSETTSTSTSCCCSMDEDKNDVMRGVWGTPHHHLTKMENGGGGYYNNLGGGHGMIKTCPPTYFGEGSTNTSHTFLSPLQFSSIWNHFSS